jgi:hypothetical protein
MKHASCAPPRCKAAGSGARRAWSGALRGASKKKRTPSRETAWGPEVGASTRLAPSSRGVGGWGATRSALWHELKSAPPQIQLPFSVAPITCSYHHGWEKYTESERHAKSQKRAARRAGGKDDTLASGPRREHVQATVSRRPGQYALPFIPARAAAPAQLGEVRRHTAGFVPGEQLGRRASGRTFRKGRNPKRRGDGSATLGA